MSDGELFTNCLGLFADEHPSPLGCMERAVDGAPYMR